MESILYQIYDGRFSPDFCTAKLKFHQKHREAYCQQNRAFLNKLAAIDPALRDEAVSLLDSQSALNLEEPAEMFAEGFSMAVKLMVEVLTSI